MKNKPVIVKPVDSTSTLLARKVSGSQLRAALRARETEIRYGEPADDPVSKRCKQIRTLTLRRLSTLIKRHKKRVEGWTRKYNAWAAETEGKLPRSEWPDLLAAIEDSTYLATAADEVLRRTTPKTKPGDSVTERLAALESAGKTLKEGAHATQ